MSRREYKEQQEKGCIQLISCIPPTDRERNNPRYVPQLEINKEAQEIISQQFEAPISIIVYVGNMGVGKSKLATITVAALEEEQPNKSLDPFQSGAGTNGLTQGVWMWKKPLQYPGRRKKGSIMILDCEGMGDLDETTSANLYLFCMLMSTTFAVILRPSRVDCYQSRRLYHALYRFEKMKARYVLPNVCLIPLELPEFVYSDQNSDDTPVSKTEWIQNIFKVDEANNRLSNNDNEELRNQYNYIFSMLPKIDAINIDYLPSSLKSNSRSINVHSLLRNDESRKYYTSIKTAINMLLASGGKRLPGSNAEHLFVRPAELATLMGDLIKVINKDREPQADELIDRYLTNRFTAEIEKEYMARFQRDLLKYAKEVLCEELNKLNQPQKETERIIMDEKFKKKHNELKKKYYDTMICCARYETIGLDSSLLSEFKDEHQRQEALSDLPMSIRHRLNILEVEMNNAREAETLIERVRHNLTILDLRRQADEKQRLLEEFQQRLCERKENVKQEKLINQSLNKADHWRVGVGPCKCGASGKSYNMVHIYCDSDDPGNLYYFNEQTNQMVCSACRKIISCRQEDARCTTCERRLRVTRIY